MKYFRPPIEPLESRIAPAIFFVDGQNLTITNSSGTPQTGAAAAATAVGATVAILLNPGDSLVYDINGDHKIDSPFDITLVKVTAGEAMAFFTDLNGSGKLDLNEFTGLAVNDGIKATINGSLHGSIDTLLDSSGNFTPAVRHAYSIAGLTIDGTVDGNIQAGGNISGVTFAVPKTGAQPLDLTGSILAGDTATNVSFNGGGMSLSPSFTLSAGTAGSNISNIVLPRGLEGAIEAGDGGDGTTGTGAAGGNITKVTLTGAIDGDILAGGGGAGAGMSGAGGAGGTVSALSLTLANDFTTNTKIEGGDGGPGSLGASGPGGAGGAVSSTVVKTIGFLSRGIGIYGGHGGHASGTGVGGAGGAVSKSSITAIDYVAGAVEIRGGGGGTGGSSGANGGAGGMVSSSSVTVASVGGSVGIAGGPGGSAEGDGATGGLGGAVTAAKLTITAFASGGSFIAGGGGGDAGSGNSSGGNGGAVSSSTFKFNGTSEDDLGIAGGYGGGVSTGNGNGGNGGAVTSVSLTALGDFFEDSLTISSGTGGSVATGNGNGGNGGNLSGVSLSIGAADADGVFIYSGYGGSATAVGNGGNSGSVSKAAITNLLNLARNSQVYTGHGGDSGTSGNGGASGNISGVVIKDLAGGPPQVEWQVFTQSGGSGAGAGHHGGNTGNLSATTFTGPHSSVVFGQADAAGGGTGGAGGGAGGSIGTINGSALLMSVLASPGGDSDTGAAGAGGSVSGVTFSVSGFARLIAAGDGGSATTSAGGGSPGVGGSITSVKITGDIGDFQTVFDVDGADSGMGGLVAGLGGQDASGAYSIAENGSITKVSATRIAAILAGETAGTSLDAYNAVASITGLKTSFIGADVNDNRTFDWESGSTPETGAGFALPPNGTNSDTPFDGLVIVTMGGFAQSATIPILPGALLFE